VLPGLSSLIHRGVLQRQTELLFYHCKDKQNEEVEEGKSDYNQITALHCVANKTRKFQCINVLNWVLCAAADLYFGY